MCVGAWVRGSVAVATKGQVAGGGRECLPRRGQAGTVALHCTVISAVAGLGGAAAASLAHLPGPLAASYTTTATPPTPPRAATPPLPPTLQRDLGYLLLAHLNRSYLFLSHLKIFTPATLATSIAI